VLAGDAPESWMDGIAEGRHLIRPMTQHLIECCQLDIWPSHGTMIDFGIVSSEHLGALQFAIREELVTPEELDTAMGHGKALTEIARRGQNPYHFVAFKTAWDAIGVEPDPFLSANRGKKPLPSPSQIVDAPKDYLPPEPQRSHTNDQDHGHEQ